MTNLLIFVLSFAAVLLTGLSSARAQGLSSSDVHEWSAFARRPAEPPLLNARTDRAFKAITHEGPWLPDRERSLSPSESRLLTLLLESKWLAALQHLKAAHPDLQRRDDVGRTPLSLAARAGQLELVREMLRQGAQPDQIGVLGMTPLAAAAFEGHDLVVHDLLRHGARPDQPTAQGQFPLHLASATGRTQTQALLFRYGADHSLFNREGRSPLHEAAYFGQVKAMENLRANGVDLGALDRYGRNAVHAAALGRDESAVTWLKSNGVPVLSVLTQVLIDQLGRDHPLH